MYNITKDFRLESLLTGFLVCLIGYSSSALIVFEVGRKFGLSTLEASSWLGVLCLAMGILSIVFSIKYKVPLLFAWSTPGAVILLNSPNGVTINEIIGTFIFSAVLIIFCGVTGLFEKIMNKIPISLSHAMLAGVLFKFALGTFTAFQSFLSLSGGMFFIYLLSKKFLPKYTIILVMISGIIISYFFHQLKVDDINYQMIALKYISPRFDLKSLIGIGLPLFIVTMTSQNLTGLSVLKSFNYKAPTSALITWSGIFNLIVAPFGGFAINLAAITAAICMGPDTHLEHHKRYTSAIVSGIIYIFMGLFCAFFGSFFSTFPNEMIAVLTGLALIGTISNSLFQIGLNMRERDAAMLTFFITASGVTLIGVGAAFWGIFVGSIYFLLMESKKTYKPLP